MNAFEQSTWSYRPRSAWLCPGFQRFHKKQWILSGATRGLETFESCKNYVERAVILTQGETLQIPPLSSRTSVSTGSTTLAEAEGDHILKALEESNWVAGGKSGTSARVGMPRTTLINKMRKRGFLCYSARSRSVHTSESTDRVMNLGKKHGVCNTRS